MSASSDTMDLAIAKLQFIQVYLEDSSMPLPPQSEQDQRAANPRQESIPIPKDSQQIQTSVHESEGEDINEPAKTNDKHPADISSTPGQSDTSSSPSGIATHPTAILQHQSSGGKLRVSARPRAPMPTRSSLAQSSFAFMLEPDDSSTSANTSSAAKLSSAFLASGKRQLGGGSREKAYLFGDEPEDTGEISRKSSLQNGGAEEFSLGTIGGSGGTLT